MLEQHLKIKPQTAIHKDKFGYESNDFSRRFWHAAVPFNN